jgi:hypothetical protein
VIILKNQTINRMKQLPLSELSQEELLKKVKTAKVAISALGGLLIVLVASTVYLTYLQGFSVFTVLPVAFLPLFIINVSNLKKIQAEIASRNT